jgi:SAM-dependent methyltransferase
MSYSMEWDARFREGTHRSLWPWSELITFVKRHVPLAHGARVLELGCGVGANIPFFLSLGVEYYAVEGSPTAVEDITARYPMLKGRVVVGDFTESIPCEGPFALVADRSALTSNSTADITRALSLVRDKLTADGKYIGIDWFSDRHSDSRKGVPGPDAHTTENLSQGALANTGRIHFSDRSHMEELFSGFVIEALEHKLIERVMPGDPFTFGAWNLAARKR